MKTIILLALLTLGSFSFSQSGSTNIFFDVDSDIMRINDIVKLQKYIHEKNEITLIGHADKSGNAEYNMNLSKRRVENVKAFLISKGYPTDKITTDYKGEALAGNKEQFYNRRVEIIYSNQSSKVNSFEDFKKSLKPETQTFWIHTTGDTTIEGNKGTTVTLATGNMIDNAGNSPSGKVKIELTEYTTNSNYFSDKLSTQSGNELIETNGMINIEAFQNDKKLNLQGGKSIEIGFPKTSDKEFTNFNGTRLKDGTMDWKNLAINQSFNVKLNGPDGVVLTSGEGSMGKTYPYKLITSGDTTGLAKFFKEQEKIDAFRNEYYDIIQSNKLDYINCDRFLRDNSQQLYMTHFEINIDDPSITIMGANIIFEDIKSIVEIYMYEEDKIASQRSLNMAIPDKVKVKIITIGQNVKTKEIYFYQESTSIEGDYIKTLSLEKSSFEEIQKHLD